LAEGWVLTLTDYPGWAPPARTPTWSGRAQEALELLARGDHDVQTAVTYAERRRAAGERNEGEWDDIRPIDPAEALGLRDEPSSREA
jgi:hypothetical protein